MSITSDNILEEENLDTTSLIECECKDLHHLILFYLDEDIFLRCFFQRTEKESSYDRGAFEYYDSILIRPEKEDSYNQLQSFIGSRYYSENEKSYIEVSILPESKEIEVTLYTTPEIFDSNMFYMEEFTLSSTQEARL